MTKTDVMCIKMIGENLERFAGETVRGKVMEGSGQITAGTSKSKVAKWVKDAMDRLDALADERTKGQIMENCGYICASRNTKVIRDAKSRRRKHKSIDDFLAAEQRNPVPGTRLEREGDVISQYYTPRSPPYSIRCYCGLFRSTDDSLVVSPTYCHCSKGFVKKWWETVLERPLRVELLQSAISGAQECKFAIYL